MRREAMQIPFYIVAVLGAPVVNLLPSVRFLLVTTAANLLLNWRLMQWLGLPGIALAATSSANCRMATFLPTWNCRAHGSNTLLCCSGTAARIYSNAGVISKLPANSKCWKRANTSACLARLHEEVATGLVAMGVSSVRRSCQCRPLRRCGGKREHDQGIRLPRLMPHR